MATRRSLAGGAVLALFGTAGASAAPVCPSLGHTHPDAELISIANDALVPRQSEVVIPFPVERTRPPAGSDRELAALINRVAELWISLPDDHPMFDGGRALLKRMGRDSNGEPL